MSEKDKQEIIQRSKLLLINWLNNYINDSELLETITNRLNRLKVSIYNNEDFETEYRKLQGKGFAPGAFKYQDCLYFRETVSTHQIIHEMLHGISSYTYENGFKSGLFVGNKKEDYIYGRGFNEAFTEYLTSIITNEQFSGYSKDLKVIIELFMNLTNYKVEDVLNLYFQKEEWLSDDAMKLFASDNESLPNLVTEYDNKLSNSSRKINNNNVVKILLTAIDNKISDGTLVNSLEIIDKLKELNQYYYSCDIDLNNDIKESFVITLDKIGSYKPRKM